MKDINRLRLVWLAAAQRGDMPPSELFEINSWGADMTEMAKDALAELASYRGMSQWLPIETAPVPPFEQYPTRTRAMRCLVQLPGNPPYVTEAEAYWVMAAKHKKNQIPVLRWRAQYLGVIEPTHWQPLPAPLKEDGA